MPKPTITYQAVREAPTESVVELYKAGGWWKEDPAWRQVIPTMIERSHCFMIARDGTQIVGMGRAISDGVSDAYIQDVVVLPSHRGMGIGAELVRRLAAHCASQGITWIGLVAEPGTSAFYERLGFVPLKNYQPMLFGKRDPP